jgi:hypothetical protein
MFYPPLYTMVSLGAFASKCFCLLAKNHIYYQQKLIPNHGSKNLLPDLLATDPDSSLNSALFW